MSESIEAFASVVARLAPLPIRPVGFSALVLYPPGCAQEGSLFKGFPTWRFRVLKTALRLRPRRALSSASGQRHHVTQKPSAGEEINSAGVGLGKVGKLYGSQSPQSAMCSKTSKNHPHVWEKKLNFFWPYQALPGLTRLDKRRRVTRVTGCIVRWEHGKRVNWVGGLIEVIELIRLISM